MPFLYLFISLLMPYILLDVFSDNHTFIRKNFAPLDVTLVRLNFVRFFILLVWALPPLYLKKLKNPRSSWRWSVPLAIFFHYISMIICFPLLISSMDAVFGKEPYLYAILSLIVLLFTYLKAKPLLQNRLQPHKTMSYLFFFSYGLVFIGFLFNQIHIDFLLRVPQNLYDLSKINKNWEMISPLIYFPLALNALFAFFIIFQIRNYKSFSKLYLTSIPFQILFYGFPYFAFYIGSKTLFDNMFPLLLSMLAFFIILSLSRIIQHRKSLLAILYLFFSLFFLANSHKTFGVGQQTIIIYQHFSLIMLGLSAYYWTSILSEIKNQLSQAKNRLDFFLGTIISLLFFYPMIIAWKKGIYLTIADKGDFLIYHLLIILLSINLAFLQKFRKTIPFIHLWTFRHFQFSLSTYASLLLVLLLFTKTFLFSPGYTFTEDRIEQILLGEALETIQKKYPELIANQYLEKFGGTPEKPNYRLELDFRSCKGSKILKSIKLNFQNQHFFPYKLNRAQIYFHKNHLLQGEINEARIMEIADISNGILRTDSAIENPLNVRNHAYTYFHYRYKKQPMQQRYATFHFIKKEQQLIVKSLELSLVDYKDCHYGLPGKENLILKKDIFARIQWSEQAREIIVSKFNATLRKKPVRKATRMGIGYRGMVFSSKIFTKGEKPDWFYTDGGWLAREDTGLNEQITREQLYYSLPGKNVNEQLEIYQKLMAKNDKTCLHKGNTLSFQPGSMAWRYQDRQVKMTGLYIQPIIRGGLEKLLFLTTSDGKDNIASNSFHFNNDKKNDEFSVTEFKTQNSSLYKYLRALTLDFQQGAISYIPVSIFARIHLNFYCYNMADQCRYDCKDAGYSSHSDFSVDIHSIEPIEDPLESSIVIDNKTFLPSKYTTRFSFQDGKEYCRLMDMRLPSRQELLSLWRKKPLTNTEHISFWSNELVETVPDSEDALNDKTSQKLYYILKPDTMEDHSHHADEKELHSVQCVKNAYKNF